MSPVSMFMETYSPTVVMMMTQMTLSTHHDEYLPCWGRVVESGRGCAPERERERERERESDRVRGTEAEAEKKTAKATVGAGPGSKRG